MSLFRRSISILLLFVFAVLLLKNLSILNGSGDCHEFAHIHGFDIQKIWSHNADSKLSQPVADAAESCHGSQSVFTGVMMPVVPCELEPVNLSGPVEFILSPDLLFESPDLEAPRRPPRV